ncbi:hypothetical protein Bca101_044427 [Brassica carinata]
MRMRKKTTKKTKAEELQTPSGIFTTLFSDEVAEAGESSGFSSIFSVNNPFRQNKPMPATNKPNIVPEESLVEVVLESHKKFLANMVWVHEEVKKAFAEVKS